MAARMLFCNPFGRDIYDLSKDSTQILCKLDLGNDTLDELFLEENKKIKNIGKFFLRANKAEKVFAIDFLNETEQFLSLWQYIKDKLAIFYDKEKKEERVYLLDKFSNSLKRLCVPILNTHKNMFVTSVIPSGLESNFNFIPKSLKNDKE